MFCFRPLFVDFSAAAAAAAATTKDAAHVKKQTRIRSTHGLRERRSALGQASINSIGLHAQASGERGLIEKLVLFIDVR